MQLDTYAMLSKLDKSRDIGKDSEHQSEYYRGLFAMAETVVSSASDNYIAWDSTVQHHVIRYEYMNRPPGQ